MGAKRIIWICFAQVLFLISSFCHMFMEILYTYDEAADSNGWLPLHFNSIVNWDVLVGLILPILKEGY